jgi:hypothetical protein
VDEDVWDWLDEEDVDKLEDVGPVLVVGAIVDVCDDCELAVSVLVALLGVLVGAAVAAVPVLVARTFESKFCLSSNSPAPTTVADHRERPRRSNEDRILTRES